MVEVRAIAAAVLDDEAYVYKVSAGKIVGTGPNVVWDLSGVKSGTYTITSGIDTGPPWGVVGLTRTRSVMVTDCVDCEEKP